MASLQLYRSFSITDNLDLIQAPRFQRKFHRVSTLPVYNFSANCSCPVVGPLRVGWSRRLWRRHHGPSRDELLVQTFSRPRVVHMSRLKIPCTSPSDKDQRYLNHLRSAHHGPVRRRQISSEVAMVGRRSGNPSTTTIPTATVCTSPPGVQRRRTR